MQNQLEKQLEYYKRLKSIYKCQIEMYTVALEELDRNIERLERLERG